MGIVVVIVAVAVIVYFSLLMHICCCCFNCQICFVQCHTKWFGGKNVHDFAVFVSGGTQLSHCKGHCVSFISVITVVTKYHCFEELNFSAEFWVCSLCTQEILWFFVQMLLSLQHVHSKQILHRDLKTQNILLDKKKRAVKVGDFGISKVLLSKSKAYTVILYTFRILIDSFIYYNSTQNMYARLRQSSGKEAGTRE